jgi:hypothetical protein
VLITPTAAHILYTLIIPSSSPHTFSELVLSTHLTHPPLTTVNYRAGHQPQNASYIRSPLPEQLLCPFGQLVLTAQPTRSTHPSPLQLQCPSHQPQHTPLHSHPSLSSTSHKLSIRDLLTSAARLAIHLECHCGAEEKRTDRAPPANQLTVRASGSRGRTQSAPVHLLW